MSEEPPVEQVAPQPEEDEDHEFCVGFCKRNVDPIYHDILRHMCIAIGGSKHQITVFNDFANAHMRNEEDSLPMHRYYVKRIHDLQIELLATKKLTEREKKTKTNSIKKEYTAEMMAIDSKQEGIEKVKYARDAMIFTTGNLIQAISAPITFAGETMEPCYSDGTPWSAEPEILEPPKMPDYLVALRLQKEKDEVTTKDCLATLKIDYDTLLSNNQAMEKAHLLDKVELSKKDEIIADLQTEVSTFRRNAINGTRNETRDRQLGYSFLKDVIYHAHAAFEYQDRLFSEMKQIFDAGQYCKIDEINYYAETVKALRMKWIDKLPLAEKRELQEPIDAEYTHSQSNLALLKMIRSKFEVMSDCYDKYKEFVNTKTNCTLPTAGQLNQFDEILIASEKDKIESMSLEECRGEYLKMLRDIELVRGRNEVLAIAKHAAEEENRKLKIDMTGMDREIDQTKKRVDAAQKRMIIMENVHDGRQMQILQLEKKYEKEVASLNEKVLKLEKIVGDRTEELTELMDLVEKEKKLPPWTEKDEEWLKKIEKLEEEKPDMDLEGWCQKVHDLEALINENEPSTDSSPQRTITELRRELRKAKERIQLKTENYCILCDIYCNAVNVLCNDQIKDAKEFLMFKSTTLHQAPGIPEKKKLHQLFEEEFHEKVEKINDYRKSCLVKQQDWEERRKKMLAQAAKPVESDPGDLEELHEWSREFQELKELYQQSLKIRTAWWENDEICGTKEFKELFGSESFPKNKADLMNLVELLKRDKIAETLEKEFQRSKDMESKLAEAEKMAKAMRDQKEAMDAMAAQHRHTCSGDADKDARIAELKAKNASQSQKLKVSHKETADLAMKQRETEKQVLALQKNLALFKKAATGAEDGLADVERIAALEQKVEEMNKKLERAQRESAEKDRQMAIVETGYLSRNGIVRVQISAGRM
ncbi:hypothetical protein CRE_24190 [Caenorhabditis remanei]|uniref:Uncharacterized protein n=1 Tax=Caenorhabditis remanei TaxID=31234 RepID=E3N991_CAERE|nr:hypothetical protein CRE_24190 [Caenorhabditis remanei]